MRLAVKICGMNSPANIREISSLSPDYLGLIFHRPSPRNACGLDPKELSPFFGKVKFVGVFVNMPLEELKAIAGSYALAAVQLHGDESRAYCKALRDNGYEVWKAIGVETAEDMEGLAEYATCVDRIVLDRKSATRGGTGQKFDWKLLDCYPLAVPFMLGGGIGPEDSEAIAGLRHPRLAGIDLNSRFESYPGIKNFELLDEFLHKIKES